MSSPSGSHLQGMNQRRSAGILLQRRAAGRFLLQKFYRSKGPLSLPMSDAGGTDIPRVICLQKTHVSAV